MASKRSAAKILRGTRLVLAFIAMTQFTFFQPLVASASPKKTGDTQTVTPIKHVIIIVGENRSFNHLFATYVPKPGESVNNLLSEGIINADGSKGPSFASAQQFSADITGSAVFQLSPTTGKTLYSPLPAPLNG